AAEVRFALSERLRRDDDDVSIAVEVRSDRSEQLQRDEDDESIAAEVRAVLPVRQRGW
ncbi:hypothetical protein A2U01_0076145, partial [Trifolium medium]|nr:hypothetical protein [Trifolium medium]